MVKRCIGCNIDVEDTSHTDDGHVFFNIVQATTIMLTSRGASDAKRQSTSYICTHCCAMKKIDWRQLIHYTWTDNIKTRADFE